MNAIFIIAQGDTPTTGGWALLITATLVAVAIIWRTGVLRRSSVLGPDRASKLSTRPLAILLLASMALWFAVQAGFIQFQQVKQQTTGQKKFDPELMTATDWAFLSVVPGTVGIILLITGHVAGRTNGAQELGFAPSRFLPGLLEGIVGLIVVLPIMVWWMMFLERFYDAIQLKHPNEHDLLRVLGNATDTGAKVAIIIGATVIAPVFEEFVFRAHLQTLFARFFTERRTAARGFAVDAGQPLPGIVEPVVETHRSPSRYWLAIIFSSVLFSLIHTPWMAPAIFVLSICLGYLYQRTGNLWATIVLHSLFNIYNTAMFLSQTK